MRKSKPVIILVAIQLAFLLIMTLIPYVTDVTVKSYGDVYTFEIQETYLYGGDEIFLDCNLKIPSDFSDFFAKRYASVETNENGISYLSEFSDEKPNGIYIGNRSHSKNNFVHFNYELPSDSTFKNNTVFFPDGWMFTNDSAYTVTADVYIFKGYLLPKNLYINGIPIEEFSGKEDINEPNRNSQTTGQQSAY